MMSRRTLQFREPLRRRPYGERPYSAGHVARRERQAFRPRGRVAPAVARRPAPHRGASA